MALSLQADPSELAWVMISLLLNRLPTYSNAFSTDRSLDDADVAGVNFSNYSRDALMRKLARTDDSSVDFFRTSGPPLPPLHTHTSFTGFNFAGDFTPNLNAYGPLTHKPRSYHVTSSNTRPQPRRIPSDIKDGQALGNLREHARQSTTAKGQPILLL